MRTVARYALILAPSSSNSISPTRAHRMPRTVLAASETAFCAAFAKLTGETPTTSITFCTMEILRPGMAHPPHGRFAFRFAGPASGGGEGLRRYRLPPFRDRGIA